MPETPKRKVDTRVVVETPEGVDFQFVLAGPGARFVAWLVDLAVEVAVIALLILLFVLIGSFLNVDIDGRDLSMALVGFGMILIFLMNWFYGSLFEGLNNGQTPGKKYAGLRVVRTNGTPVDLISATGRNFLRTVDLMPPPVFYTLGLVSMLMTRRMQRIGDLIFDTMVIDERRDWISRAGGLTARVDPIARSECPKRFAVPERTLAVIERLFEPDRVISDARREEIAKPLSEAIRRRLGYEDPPPDPANPHAYFQGHGFRHTRFLLRVLKTFATDPKAASKSTTAPSDRSAEKFQERTSNGKASSLNDLAGRFASNRPGGPGT